MKPTTLKQTLYSVLLLITLSTPSCDKEDPTPSPSACCDCLKEATTTGRGTLSMKIDGKIWSNCNVKNPSYPTVSVYRDPEHLVFEITGTKYFSKQFDEEFIINIAQPFSGDYIDKFNYGQYVFRLFYDSQINGNAEFSMDTTKPYTLHVHHLDEVKHIISGTFECWMIENDGGIDTTTLHITEGRFDTKY